MLSILIPTYNQDISKLVNDLYLQAKESYTDFEIIVMEDCSNLYVAENKKIKQLDFCRHIELDQNIGRSAIRNKLADEAKFNHLLFIDCDAEVCTTHFVEKYLSFCKEECVVIGGTAYDENEQNPAFSLRLKYGRIREARSAIQRSKHNTYHNFATFNFLISKSLFNKVRFDETIRGYGHEDTLFGHQLHELGCDFIQIENPLIHRGLDNNETFIQKTEEGTRNLYLLYQTGHYPFLIDESKLLHTFVKIRSWKLNSLFALKFIFTKKILRWLLNRKSPSLLLYDLYKILFLCKLSIEK
jgi:glycosyltransferase involved in cell wall biosynthesis